MVFEKIKKFTPLVVSISRKSSGISTLNTEDIEQELWLKILEVYPKYQDIKETEIYGLMKVILENKIISMSRLYKIRPDAGYQNTEIDELLETNSVESLVTHISEISIAVSADRYANSTNMLFAKEILDLVLDWLRQQDDQTQNFINEALSPSEKTQDIWELKIEKTPRLSHYIMIPPLSLSKILEIPQRKYYDIVQSLKQYLTTQGYNINQILDQV